jgi:peptidoglycan/xylan/chitin deacetylase (PgdA/CDA1 family)
MSVDQLRDLASHHFLGSHGHSHISLGEITRSEARLEIKKSRELLEAWTGQAPLMFSYPYGNIYSCAPPIDRLVAECGFPMAFTMERAGNINLKNPFFMARFADSDLPGGNHAEYELNTFFDSVPEAKWYR